MFAALALLASGLDYVPYDGFAATLHKGEMVIPADLSEQIRGLPAANTATGNGGELKSIERRLESIQKQSGKAEDAQVGLLADMQAETRKQSRILDEVRKSSDRMLRKIENVA